MRERTFVMRRQTVWERLEALLARADRGGLRALKPLELQDLACSTAPRPAISRPRRAATTRPRVRDYLNRLTARAHAYVYVDAARPAGRERATFFGETFPREVRTSWRSIAACTALTVIAALVAYWLVAERSQNAYALLPAEFISDDRQTVARFELRLRSRLLAGDGLAHHHQQHQGRDDGFRRRLDPRLSDLLVDLGKRLHGRRARRLYAQKGFGLDFWATISPHGVIELSAIQIAGGLGILIGASNHSARSFAAHRRAQSERAPGRYADARRRRHARRGRHDRGLYFATTHFNCVSHRFRRLHRGRAGRVSRLDGTRATRAENSSACISGRTLAKGVMSLGVRCVLILAPC
jgi:hypothetical protein